MSRIVLVSGEIGQQEWRATVDADEAEDEDDRRDDERQEGHELDDGSQMRQA